jgi:hypothetical protein
MKTSAAQFPPQPTHPGAVALVIEAYASVVGDRSAVYVSSPLTTGERSRRWHDRDPKARAAVAEADSESFKTDVLVPNRRDAAKFVASLRANENRVVIDPGALGDIAGWTQSDYRFLWARVIERYCSRVVFREGWQHSDGCAWELLSAYLAGCSLLNEDLKPLQIGEAETLLERATSTPDSTERSDFRIAVVASLQESRIRREWHDPS